MKKDAHEFITQLSADDISDLLIQPDKWYKRIDTSYPDYNTEEFLDIVLELFWVE